MNLLTKKTIYLKYESCIYQTCLSTICWYLQWSLWKFLLNPSINVDHLVFKIEEVTNSLSNTVHVNAVYNQYPRPSGTKVTLYWDVAFMSRVKCLFAGWLATTSALKRYHRSTGANLIVLPDCQRGASPRNSISFPSQLIRQFNQLVGTLTPLFEVAFNQSIHLRSLRFWRGRVIDCCLGTLFDGQ